MKILLTILLFVGLYKSSFGCCAEENRTLTEMLFETKQGTIFTCKVLTMIVPKQTFRSSDGSIDGTATVEIINVFFGHVDTNVVTLHAGDYMEVGKSYIIYTSGSGRIFAFGGICDRWSKQVTDNINVQNELQTLKQFSDIIKNKATGEFIFKNSKNAVIAQGKFKKGRPVKIWKHYYDNGIVKAEYDIAKGITIQYSDKGEIKSKNTIVKNVGIYEHYSDKIIGQLEFTFLQITNDTGLTLKCTEYFANGKIKQITNEIDINTKEGSVKGTTSTGRTGEYKEYYENGNLKVSGQYITGKRKELWKWYNENGSLKTEVDYKDGTGKQ
jgi:antitoxin component YwqK of YwqJK toxin-antitoxin module